MLTASDVFVSMASVWEIAIKVSIGKFNLQKPIDEFIAGQLESAGLDLLGISVAHAAEVSRMPLHHRDPFDRLLVAQAKVEQMTLVSVDDKLDAYGIDRLW